MPCRAGDSTPPPPRQTGRPPRLGLEIVCKMPHKSLCHLTAWTVYAAWTRNARRPRVLVAAVLVLGGCAGSTGSAREPEADPGGDSTVAHRDAFRLKDRWSWDQSVAGPEPATGRPPCASALFTAVLGVFPAARFWLTTGDCERCRTANAALW